MSPCAAWADHDAVALADLVARGEASAAELLETALSQTAALNPALNAVVLLQPETARRMIAQGLPDGPLRGVPFLLKDLGAEAVDFPSHSGSRLLSNTRHRVDGELYLRLRRAGVVVFGRTCAPEGGVGATTEARVYGGPTRNPWDPSRTAGGSSGGAGAAVAAGIVPAAQGSDGGGSVRIPASNCGLFGFKPTRGHMPEGPLSGEGWAGMATDGFLTRSVRDTAVLLDATIGPDLGAPYLAPPLERRLSEAIALPPRRLRIALCATTLDGAAIHPECQAAVAGAARLLEDLGHAVEDARPMVEVRAMMGAWTKIVACGTALWVRSRLKALGRGLRPGDLEPSIEGAVRYAATLNGADYLEAVEAIHAFGRQLAAFFVEHDALVTATMAEPPALLGRFAPTNPDFLDWRLGESGMLGYSPFAPAYNASGQPATTLPLHWSHDGLPVGVQIAAAFGEDALLMALSAQIEAAQPWFHRRPPPMS